MRKGDNMHNTQHAGWLTDFLEHIDMDLRKFDVELSLVKIDENDVKKIVEHIDTYNSLCNYRTSARFAGHLELLFENGFISRPLRKLRMSLEIVETTNESHSKSKSFASVPIFIC